MSDKKDSVSEAFYLRYSGSMLWRILNVPFPTMLTTGDISFLASKSPEELFELSKNIEGVNYEL